MHALDRLGLIRKWVAPDMIHPPGDVQRDRPLEAAGLHRATLTDRAGR
ncbi:hypothetical protein [Paraburkholderia sp.]|jgi:hypothetical protein